MKNLFGLCWRGTHPLLKTDGDVLSNHGIVNLWSEAVEKFMDIEGLGVKDTCSCGNFKCGKSINKDKECLMKEEKEMRMIDAGLEFNENKCQ